ncbi:MULTISPECIES: MBL fold metallo-hydrolase [unclassified Methanoculleus]|uniref:MBL fold metallo-hydrolase n=1 Tax=unclassified Methanoculleus TaxID=2619537 RepID=UPI0025DF831F|nr:MULTISPECIES: MBL fold metallo-hydrolase [unclassified Methanoculleus]MCK9318353.1 MBL fold metallo-hydrolase [Methanoculleus sp.]MDD2253257.1 MBL fold metallo-hydrolase [Methanoculleus sp.]MDD2787152.1 MBL fold metallo-hydrolase [Methanoculleus sp.]MDD3215505.1 MBL fold metallo-hydrolase [Methanoculleus sp.]MDD4313221.1 MBL fold metallo-hydrolase [Methanoculleus sp.]
MRLTVLVDNATLTDRYFLAEPGLSIYIEDGGTRVLFDTGYSGILVENARKMGIDLLRIEEVVLSHGHLDHTWGLDALLRLHTEGIIEGHERVEPTFIAHPEAFLTRSLDGAGEIGSHLSVEELFRHGRVLLTAAPLWLTENLVFLGEIERRFEFERTPPHGYIYTPDGIRDDTIADDTALACKTPDGLVVVTGCSHSGVCSIIEQAREVCGEDRVADVIGGFHLLDAPPERIQGVVDYFSEVQPAALHPCHCTDLAAKVALAKVANVRETGVGLILEYG